MKVTELLSVSEFTGMSLIAGAAGKNREVNTVNMMDAPDIIHFLNPDEMLITTAYHLKDHPDQLVELIRAMHAQGCAALGIKTKRFLQEIPLEVLELADALAFPIIELPLDLSLGEIVNYTLRAILDQHATELAHAFETHKQFTRIVLQGEGIPKLLQDLSNMINHPVHLINQHLKPLYTTNYDSDFYSFMGSIRKNVFYQTMNNTARIYFSLCSTKQSYTLFPVYFNEKKSGFLSILGEIHQPSTLLTIEQAINVISFALMKEQALKQQSRNIRNDFFTHFLDQAFSTDTEIMNRATEFSLFNDQKYICAIGKVDDTDQYFSYRERQQIIDDIYEFLEEELQNSSSVGHLFTLGDRCIVLYEIEEASSFIETSLNGLQQKVSTYFNKTISFGVSNVSHTFLQTRHAYSEALDALAQGELLKQRHFIQVFQTKDVTELLRLIPAKELRNFYTYALQGFTCPETEDEQTLIQTLSVFLDSNCQISETAKRLFVHRNTVVYRIEKCEEILGKTLKEPETTLQLRVALRIKALLEI